MQKDVINSIMRRQWFNGRVLFRRDNGTRRRVKLVYGPFGMLTKRYLTDDETCEALKARLASGRTRIDIAE
ncbi:MAG: hypothetical protein AAF468_14130 [Pseudomonadota bacterium]